MPLFPRTTRTVSPLSAEIESLLRGLPAATPADPARAKMSLLAAFERGRPVEGSTIFRALRIAVPAGALAASVVLGVGVFGSRRPADLGMVRRGDVAMRGVAGVAEARLPVVDRPQMPVLMSALGEDAP